MITPRELKLLLREYVAESPGDCGELLKIIADGMHDYELAQTNKRGSLADNAVLSLIGSLQRGDVTIPSVIDVAIHQFPHGLGGHAPVEKRFWAMFLDEAMQRPVDRGWLADVKGPEYVVWWDAHVEPSLNLGDKS